MDRKNKGTRTMMDIFQPKKHKADNCSAQTKIETEQPSNTKTHHRDDVAMTPSSSISRTEPIAQTVITVSTTNSMVISVNRSLTDQEKFDALINGWKYFLKSLSKSNNEVLSTVGFKNFLN